uniref:Uncharacterized protein n=1 Tax=Globodera rostochiensis TaxID=31243 RepID=A0A914I4M5_GLORO
MLNPEEFPNIKSNPNNSSRRRQNRAADWSFSEWHAKLLPFHKYLVLTAFCLGSFLFVILLSGKSHYHHKLPNHRANNGFSPEEVREAIFDTFDPNRIADNLRQFTQEPHVAGTDSNRKVAERIANLWKQNGLEDVHFVPYDVLLSYPNFTSPNHLSVLSADGRVNFRTEGISPELKVVDSSEAEDLSSSIQWLAYSAEGTVEGEAVYCHYGRREDFERLEKEFNISTLEGKIAILRYNVEFRGDKVRNAQERGAIGAILYSDPAEVAREGIAPGHTFPSAVWMPDGGVQRGSLKQPNGDPLTPLLPSRADFFKERTLEEVQENKVLPSIPVLPLSYGDAAQILSRMGGPKVPLEWQGNCGNFPYHIGPSFDKGQRLKLEVQSKMEIRTVQNVIGYIRGAEFPDEWVMLGNHFDAWVFGSIDPNSGSAILAEVGRAFAEVVKTKAWRPKRTLVFCAWDAEEHGMIGSTEFVEEFANVLAERAVVYLNVDLISNNQSLDVRTVPSLYTAVTKAAKTVPNPMASERQLGRETMFDTWLNYFPAPTSWLPDTPKMAVPGGGSDQATFLLFLGIPVVDLTYRNASWLTYPLYHSRYELPYVNEHLFDNNDLAVHKAVGQYWAELGRAFADSPLLPINATIFAHKLLADYVGGVKEPIMSLYARFPDATKAAVGQLSHLLQNVRLFIAQAQHFERALSEDEQPKLAWANRRLQKLDQCFVNPTMGPAREEPEKRHVLFSQAQGDSYQVDVMAAVQKKMAQLENAQTVHALCRQHPQRYCLKMIDRSIIDQLL